LSSPKPVESATALPLEAAAPESAAVPTASTALTWSRPGIGSGGAALALSDQSVGLRDSEKNGNEGKNCACHLN
jgi:hypothetical protein